MKNSLRFLLIGDLIGKAGCTMFSKWAPRLKEKYKIDTIIVNGENSADNGRGITPPIANFIFESGASVITSGNHIWGHKNIYNYINEEERLIRPANYPSSCPGKGFKILNVEGHEVAVVSLQGRVFMSDQTDCPFKTMESILSYIKTRTNIILVDFHAEATSEKEGMGSFLDGKVSAALGTHTHVQTADEKILPNGTAYISDLGFCGAVNSMLGMQTEAILNKLITSMPSRFKVELNGPMVLTGAWVEIDISTGKALKIERVNIIDDEIIV